MARQRRQNDLMDIDSWGGGVGSSENSRFAVTEIDLKRPLEAASKGLLWFFVLVPVGVAFIWGVYDSSNIAGVLGISARRGTGAFIEETKPIGQTLVNGTSGKGFAPAKQGGTAAQSLRPGATESQETNGAGVTGVSR